LRGEAAVFPTPSTVASASGPGARCFWRRWSRQCRGGSLEALIEPHYPKSGSVRPPYALSTMLRIHCLQQWYGLSDSAMEETLYEIASMRQFAGLSLARAAVPDERMILKFRHLLEPARPGAADLRDNQGAPAGEGVDVAAGHDRRCHVSLRARVRPRTARVNVTRRCIRSARAISFTSA
jgi:hypothetical protein